MYWSFDLWVWNFGFAGIQVRAITFTYYQNNTILKMESAYIIIPF